MLSISFESKDKVTNYDSIALSRIGFCCIHTVHDPSWKKEIKLIWNSIRTFHNDIYIYFIVVCVKTGKEMVWLQYLPWYIVQNVCRGNQIYSWNLVVSLLIWSYWSNSNVIIWIIGWQIRGEDWISCFHSSIPSQETYSGL